MKIIISLSFYLIFSATIAGAADVRVSAAASMTEAVRVLIAHFNQQQPEVSVYANFAGSGSLAKQIHQGAPVDIYISANRRWLDYLLEQGRLAPQSLSLLARNQLIFVGRENSGVKEIADLPRLSLVGMGTPRNVPAGHYAAQAMEAVGIYTEMTRDHKLVMAKDVRQALLYADRGEVDGAFVYRTDGRLARNSVLLFTVDEGLHDPITYPMALTVSGAQKDGAKAFFTFLQSKEALALLIEFNFLPPGEAHLD
ncbi:MAG: molybdate ABC transporter substrate-binding protein [Thermodesulfobacteriota bacterium]